MSRPPTGQPRLVSIVTTVSPGAGEVPVHSRILAYSYLTLENVMLAKARHMTTITFKARRNTDSAPRHPCQGTSLQGWQGSAVRSVASHKSHQRHSTIWRKWRKSQPSCWDENLESSTTVKHALRERHPAEESSSQYIIKYENRLLNYMHPFTDTGLAQRQSWIIPLNSNDAVL